MKIVGTAIIANQEHKILVGKRPVGKALAGLWEFPGGKQEDGESIEQCIIREIKEELNVCCRVGDFLLTVAKHYEYGDFKLMVYQAFVDDLSPLHANVHQELKWLSPQEMKAEDFPPADVDIIDYLQQKM